MKSKIKIYIKTLFLLYNSMKGREFVTYLDQRWEVKMAKFFFECLPQYFIEMGYILTWWLAGGSFLLGLCQVNQRNANITFSLK